MTREFTEDDRMRSRLLAGKMFYDSLTIDQKARMDALSDAMIENLKNSVYRPASEKKRGRGRYEEKPRKKVRKKEPVLTATIGDMLAAKKVW